MKDFRQFVNGKKLVVVDVQPSYAKNIHFMRQFPQFLSSYQDILCLYNGPDFGMENKQQIAKFYYANGVPKNTINRLKWYQKNYAFFRDLMGQGCYLRKDLVKLIRFMFRKRINDIRNLSQEDVEGLAIPELAYHALDNYGFYLPDLYGVIWKWNGADICGGGLNECLEEVLLLADAMRLKFNIIHDFVY